jgi:hypothetical protein
LDGESGRRGGGDEQKIKKQDGEIVKHGSVLFLKKYLICKKKKQILSF